MRRDIAQGRLHVQTVAAHRHRNADRGDAREAYRALISIRTGATPIGEPPAERGRRLRELRVTHGIAQQQVSDALGVHSSRISEIERGTRNLPELERRATLWIQTITTPNQPNQHAETLDNV
ncbi:MAG: helix-turn-helix transcriptional regulator [Bifidobacterium thermacidophilum]|nr:helix-turn-helix transcriptional regulator [Bifidobacterium thermacidophilum]